MYVYRGRRAPLFSADRQDSALCYLYAFAFVLNECLGTLTLVPPPSPPLFVRARHAVLHLFLGACLRLSFGAKLVFTNPLFCYTTASKRCLSHSFFVSLSLSLPFSLPLTFSLSFTFSLSLSLSLPLSRPLALSLALSFLLTRLLARLHNRYLSLAPPVNFSISLLLLLAH